MTGTDEAKQLRRQAQALTARAFAPKASPTSKPPLGIVNAGNELITVLMLLDRPGSAEAVLRAVSEVEDWSPAYLRLEQLKRERESAEHQKNADMDALSN